MYCVNLFTLKRLGVDCGNLSLSAQMLYLSEENFTHADPNIQCKEKTAVLQMYFLKECR